jgi:hypothetical protein
LLDDWRVEYPDAAERFIAWNARQPDYFKVLVFWRMTHPYESVGPLFSSRSGWGELSAVRESHPKALEDFLLWIRASGIAAEELAVHRGALEYLLAPQSPPREEP